MAKNDLIDQRPFKTMINDPKVQERFEKMLGDNSTAFLMSALNVVQGNNKLQTADPQSVLMACAVSATLNLPVDPSLSMAFIVPYAGKAQFQIGYKGLIELGHRSQQYRGLNVSDVRGEEYKGIDRMTGRMEFEWIKDNDARYKLPITGYVAYFELRNGFSKALYMTENEITQHAAKYSKTFNHKDGQWKKNRPGMAKKTVLKLLLDKWSPKSVDMRKAIQADQAVIGDWDGNKLEYPDNPNGVVDLDKLYADQLKKINDLMKIDGLTITEDDRMNIQRIIDEKEVESYKKVVILLESKKPKNAK